MSLYETAEYLTRNIGNTPDSSSDEDLFEWLHKISVQYAKTDITLETSGKLDRDLASIEG